MADNDIKTCSICGRDYTGWGNNAQPINNGQCCDECNQDWVLPRRLQDHDSTKETRP